MTQVRMSPKLANLCKWKHIGEVNKQLDEGQSPNSVAAFINRRGFKISVPMVYEYSKLRRQALLKGIAIERLVGVATDKTPVLDKQDPDTQVTQNKLRSELDALNLLIQSGYNSLRSWTDSGKPIAPKTLMDAIKLKHELTDGELGFLTNEGLEELRDVERKKYNMLMEHLISYIPEDKREEAVSKMEVLEDEYYQETPYYEEYVKALNLTDAEKRKKLEAYYQKQKN